MLRYAISPTADMSINDLRIAILNFILSKQKNEELLIRIDDTNKEKNIEGKDKEILELLNLFSIEYSRVVAQSENIKYHIGMGMNLLLDKKAFNCFCSDEALNEDKKKAKKEGKPYSYSGFCESISDETKFHCNAPFVVRLKKPEENISFVDGVNGKISYKPFEVDSFVILNQDKTPTANFACAVDDMLYDISAVIRDEKYLATTPRQIHTRKTLGYDKQIEYTHIPTLKDKDGKAVYVKTLIDEGFLPSAIANYIILLGFDAPKEIFSLEEAMEWFDIKKLSLDVVFDMDKLKAINKEYLKEIDDMRLSKLLGFADSDIGVLGKLYLDEASTINEIKEKVDSIFNKKDSLDSDSLKLKESIKGLAFIESFDEFKKQVSAKSDISEDIDTKLRFLLTGAKKGPKLDKVYDCIKNYLGEII